MENLRVVNISEYVEEGWGLSWFDFAYSFVCLFVWRVGVSLKLWRMTAHSLSSLYSCGGMPLFWEAQTDVILFGFSYA